ncbi:polysaccharide deacetylase family protein [Tenacibaculum maritimum]|nr:polysaccharide deacetylase family protein [Tenacibaculum maritimum]MDB0601495.1 polysaccharide deacetylase family protein [Tenacibaculum maritimum]MDB0612957.1 polysaccharide deacetylase family protein [Tenacibaculum maritimum]
MINIIIPNNNVKERIYIIDIFFNSFLKLDYKLKISETLADIELIYKSKKILIKDYFFSNYPKELSYLDKISIPSEIKKTIRSKFVKSDDLPIIYGEDFIEEINDKITCNIDIFASSFFMLTRWEEYVLRENKDKFGRFDENKSLSIRFNFYKKPIVNEYLNILIEMLTYIGVQVNNEKEYKLKVTHDVDQIYRYDRFEKYIKAIGGDLFLRKNPLLIFKTTKDYIKSAINRKYDPYNTFNYLMEVSERGKLKSHFYFIPSLKGEEDARYSVMSKQVRSLILKIKNRGHIVGVHGSWTSFNNNEIFKKQLSRLKEMSVEEGRQHYLRFENPKTWQIWEDNGLKIDSTLGFYGRNGFRCGVCYEFPVFNILERKKLRLIEQPLIFMENSLLSKNYTVEKVLTELEELSKQVKKFSGTFVFLWHPNNFNNEWKELGNYYKSYIKILIK